jgi:hypothetical protein
MTKITITLDLSEDDARLVRNTSTYTERWIELLRKTTPIPTDPVPGMDLAKIQREGYADMERGAVLVRDIAIKIEEALDAH